MPQKMYDFLTWVSFPSSLKLVSFPYVEGGARQWRPWIIRGIPVTPGKELKLQYNAKKQNLMFDSSIVIYGLKGEEARWLGVVVAGTGTLDWRTYTRSSPDRIVVPEDIKEIGLVFPCGAGVPPNPGITWFDDLKIYMDDKLIYDKYFTALRPGKVIPTVWTPPERIIGAVQRWKQGEKALIFKPPRLLQTIKV